MALSCRISFLSMLLALPALSLSGREQHFVFALENGMAADAPSARGTAGAEEGLPWRGGDGPGFFFVDLPPGNYRVAARLGHPQRASRTTLKCELRRLVVEEVALAAGEDQVVSFSVNVRTPEIPAGKGIEAGKVRLKAPRETTDEAWSWDARLTLEVCGEEAAVRELWVEPAAIPTLFLLGDSTVADQSKEPYASWGQMLPRFFTEGVAVANHAESGETYRDAFARRRIDKILSSIQPGDTFLVQFGHNDQKQLAKGQGAPFTTFAAEVRRCAEEARARGARVVLVTSMERRAFSADGSVVPSLADYAEAVRQVGKELGLPVIDLNQLSRPFYTALEALGPDRSALAFAPGDKTHHNNYGAYQLARLVAQELQRLGEPVAAHLRADFLPLDPAAPPAPETFTLPASARVTVQRPLGD